MQKKLTITLDEEVYEGLHRVIGRRRIFLVPGALGARPHVVDKDLEVAYLEMAQDEAREEDAREWSEGLIGNVDDEPR
jgi:hypothetical protein